MNIGIFNFITEYAMPVTDLAREVEERGFDSLWLPEHTHIPTSRKSPYPEADELPKEYLHTLDQFTTLSAAAAVTSTIKLGTGITLIIERDTITAAKAAATLDYLSGGRLLFGLGGGWNQEEAEHHGTQWDTRFKRLEEQMQALKIIFTEDEAEFHGKYVDFDPIWAWPKPVQKPHPPMFLGGETIHTLRRIVKYGDGWLPRARWPEKVLEGVTTLRQLAEEEGREPSSINISIFAMPPDPDWVSRFTDAGVDRLIFFLPPDDADATRRRLDRVGRFLD
ncbi:MAG: TIGR03619 family F420-dependent LLM class oxidoreductase [Gammaproteobacteria bacterium]|nr:TIGR03619 family F420-dependent LLM class oxidoreductase [Gammaproteobacteria bacterium]